MAYLHTQITQKNNALLTQDVEVDVRPEIAVLIGCVALHALSVTFGQVDESDLVSLSHNTWVRWKFCNVQHALHLVE